MSLKYCYYSVVISMMLVLNNCHPVLVKQEFTPEDCTLILNALPFSEIRVRLEIHLREECLKRMSFFWNGIVMEKGQPHPILPKRNANKEQSSKLFILDLDQTIINTKLTNSIMGKEQVKDTNTRYGLLYHTTGFALIAFRKDLMIFIYALKQHNYDIMINTHASVRYAIIVTIFMELMYEVKYNEKFHFDCLIARHPLTVTPEKKNLRIMHNYGYQLWKYKQIVIMDDLGSLAWNAEPIFIEELYLKGTTISVIKIKPPEFELSGVKRATESEEFQVILGCIIKEWTEDNYLLTFVRKVMPILSQASAMDTIHSDSIQLYLRKQEREWCYQFEITI